MVNEKSSMIPKKILWGDFGHCFNVNKCFPILYHRFAFDTKIVERVQLTKALDYQSI